MVEDLANHMRYWEKELCGVTTRDNGDGTIAMLSEDGKQILQMPDDVREGFTKLRGR
jgi:hypothetical protein